MCPLIAARETQRACPANRARNLASGGWRPTLPRAAQMLHNGLAGNPEIGEALRQLRLISGFLFGRRELH